MTRTKTTAGAAFEHNRAEALRRLRLITEAVTSAGRGEAVNWGHVGDMSEIVTYLGRAAHWAGLEEFDDEE